MNSSKISSILREFWPNSDLKSSNGSVPRFSRTFHNLGEDRDAQQPDPLREQPLRGAGRLRGGGHRRREEEVKAGRGTDVKTKSKFKSNQIES